MHLEAPRRDLFLRAREELLGCSREPNVEPCRSQTTTRSTLSDDGASGPEDSVPEGSDFWLLDKAGTTVESGRQYDRPVCPTTMWCWGENRVAASLCHFGARRRRVRSYDIASKKAPTSTATKAGPAHAVVHGIKFACATAKWYSCLASTTPAPSATRSISPELFPVHHLLSWTSAVLSSSMRPRIAPGHAKAGLEWFDRTLEMTDRYTTTVIAKRRDRRNEHHSSYSRGNDRRRAR